MYFAAIEIIMRYVLYSNKIKRTKKNQEKQKDEERINGTGQSFRSGKNPKLFLAISSRSLVYPPPPDWDKLMINSPRPPPKTIIEAVILCSLLSHSVSLPWALAWNAPRRQKTCFVLRSALYDLCVFDSAQIGGISSDYLCQCFEAWNLWQNPIGLSKKSFNKKSGTCFLLLM